MGADLLAAGWDKVYNPRAAALHSHDYGLIEDRRYFDEYRGLRDSAISRHSGAGPGAAEATWFAGPRGVVGGIRKPIAHPARRARALAAAAGALDRPGAVLHGASRLRRPRRRRRPCRSRCGRCSRSSDGATASRRVPPPRRRGATRTPCASSPTRSCRSPRPRRSTALRGALELAWSLPPSRSWRRSGHDASDHARARPPGGTAARSGCTTPTGSSTFERLAAPADRPRLRAARGADRARVRALGSLRPGVAMAPTRPSFRCSGCRTAHGLYLVQDPDPEFCGASAKALLAEHVQARAGLHRQPGQRLAELLRERYGARATAFELGVDPSEYHARPGGPETEDGTAVFYARDFTPRRGVELGLLALELLHRQRPDLRIVLYGTHNLVRAPFASEQLGVETSERLSRLYAEALRGPQPVTDELLADSERDAGLRSAGGGAGGARLRGSTARTARFSRSRATTRATSPRSSPPPSRRRAAARAVSRGAGLRAHPHLVGRHRHHRARAAVDPGRRVDAPP